MKRWCGRGVGAVTDKRNSDSNVKEKAHWAQWHKVCTDMDSCGDQINKNISRS